MNERIKQLAIQCYETGPIGKDGWPEYSKFNEEKFAELIVQECAGIAITAASDTNFITGISEADKRALSIAVEIKQHFGVEE